MAYTQAGPGAFGAEPANADLSASQWCGVVLNSSGKLVLASAGGAILGILQDKPKNAGEYGTFQHSAIGKAKAGGTFNAGDALMMDGSGQVIAATSTNQIVGRAEQAGASGRIVSILIRSEGKM